MVSCSWARSYNEARRSDGGRGMEKDSLNLTTRAVGAPSPRSTAVRHEHPNNSGTRFGTAWPPVRRYCCVIAVATLVTVCISLILHKSDVTGDRYEDAIIRKAIGDAIRVDAGRVRIVTVQLNEESYVVRDQEDKGASSSKFLNMRRKGRYLNPRISKPIDQIDQQFRLSAFLDSELQSLVADVSILLRAGHRIHVRCIAGKAISIVSISRCITSVDNMSECEYKLEDQTVGSFYSFHGEFFQSAMY